MSNSPYSTKPLNWRGDPNSPAALYQAKWRAWCAAHPGQTRKVPIEHAIRRVEAMQAMGWSYNEIGKIVGMQRQALCKMIRHNKYVNRAYLARIHRAYLQLAFTEPTGGSPQEQGLWRKVKRDARKRGYAPALAWDNIDNLEERPKGIRGYGHRPAVSINKSMRAQRLLDSGMRTVDVCKELDISRFQLYRALERDRKNASRD